MTIFAGDRECQPPVRRQLGYNHFGVFMGADGGRNAKGVAQDNAQAVTWYRKAADNPFMLMLY
ncbi:MAG: hypothetical protein ACRC1W_12625 [Shewanella sp.]